MRSVFFSIVFLITIALPAQADEILVCASKGAAFPETKLQCTTKDGKDKGSMTTLKKLYKDDWKIAEIVIPTLSQGMLIYLEKD